MMADTNLKTPINARAISIKAVSLPPGFSPAYQQYVLNQALDFTRVVGKTNEAGQGAYDAQERNDQQDIAIEDHETRITAAEAELKDHETRITSAEAELIDHENRIAAAEVQLADHETRITATETELDSHENRIVALEQKTTRRKSEVTFTGLTLNIPTTATNLITLLKTLTPASGTFAPFFDTTADKMVVFNENKTANFKLSIIGTWTGGSTNRSMQLTFSGAVPDTLVNSRDEATSTDNVLLTTFFSVDQGGFLATNGSTLTIKSNGSAFTANTIKMIAEQ